MWCEQKKHFLPRPRLLVRHLPFAQPLGRPAWLAMGEVATGSDRLFHDTPLTLSSTPAGVESRGEGGFPGLVRQGPGDPLF
jgi:hypothetical protein